MSVLNYLQSRASNAILSENERVGINTSISTLSSRLNAYFTTLDDGLRTHFRFGSSTRGTILPRYIDSRSDIDYMVVFQKEGYQPQTYLNRLKNFVEYRYGSSEIYQSSPTVVLELNHIKFELVPALHYWGTTYQIPNGPNAWQTSNPTEFSATLEAKNTNEAYLIKPAIRLAKIWNAKSGYVFNSYLFEQQICGLYYPLKTNLKTYLFTIFDNLYENQSAYWKNEKIRRAKEIIANVRDYEANGMPYSAELEIKKLIPEY